MTGLLKGSACASLYYLRRKQSKNTNEVIEAVLNMFLYFKSGEDNKFLLLFAVHDARMLNTYFGGKN